MILRLRSAALSLTAVALVFLAPPLLVAGVLLAMSDGDPAQMAQTGEDRPLQLVDADVR